MTCNLADIPCTLLAIKVLFLANYPRLRQMGRVITLKQAKNNPNKIFFSDNFGV